ncbi:MAG: hypothetical protein QOI04_1141 [Verrucomicrobiota bacterium]|jgi:hypothetical protein
MNLLRDAPRWIFFATLAFAPWAYGGTTATSIETINWLLLATLLLWAAELIVCRRKPQFPTAILFIALVLLVVGGWMSLNAMSIYDPMFQTFAPISNVAPRAPGSIDYAISVAWMIRAALLFGVILFVTDLSQDNGWLLRLWQAIGFVAGSIALLGLLQKATGAGMIFWEEPPGEKLTTFFATYYYHANAGAFLNLVWPLTAGLAVRAFSSGAAGPGVRATWLIIFMLNMAAIAANTSRMAQFIAIGCFLAICWQLGPPLIRRLSRVERSIALAGAVVILLTLFALGQAVHLEQPLTRWAHLSENFPRDARWLASRVAFDAMHNVGVFGFGPGTFRAVFPMFNNAAHQPAPGSWRFLHEDYLQTLLEWGWVGSALWVLLIFGGIAEAVRNLRKEKSFRRSQRAEVRGQVKTIGGRREWTPRRRMILPLVIIALASVLVHALVDFPLQIMSIQLYVATYLGLCWGSGDWKGERLK